MGPSCARRAWRRCFRAMLLSSMLLVASTAFAQLERGSISGTISDQSGAVVPGATVTVTNAQGQQLVAVTDASGFYTFPNLLAGRYTIAAELQGFKKVVRENVTLDATGALNL